MSFNPYRSKVSDAEHACEQCKDHMHLVISPKAHNALDVYTLSLGNVVGNVFLCMCISSRIATIMVLEHTNICIYYEDLSHCFKNIPSNPGYVLVTANGTTWKKDLCWNLDSKLLTRNFTIL